MAVCHPRHPCEGRRIRLPQLPSPRPAIAFRPLRPSREIQRNGASPTAPALACRPCCGRGGRGHAAAHRCARGTGAGRICAIRRPLAPRHITAGARPDTPQSGGRGPRLGSPDSDGACTGRAKDSCGPERGARPAGGNECARGAGAPGAPLHPITRRIPWALEALACACRVPSLASRDGRRRRRRRRRRHRCRLSRPDGLCSRPKNKNRCRRRRRRRRRGIIASGALEGTNAPGALEP